MLLRHYGVARTSVVDLVVDLLGRVNMNVLDADREFVIAGLQLCRVPGRVSFVAASIWAAARSRPVG